MIEKIAETLEFTTQSTYIMNFLTNQTPKINYNNQTHKSKSIKIKPNKNIKLKENTPTTTNLPHTLKFS